MFDVLKTQDLVGRPVISLGGEEIGTISKVIVNPETAMVAGFTISVKGIFKGDKALEFNAVHSFGNYAVTIANSARIVPLNSLPALEKLAQTCNLYGIKVLTPSGNLVGGVEDFSFAPADGKIVNFVISGGLIKNLMHGRALINAGGIEKIGPDLIIARDEVEEYIKKDEPGLQESIDNLKEDLHNWKDDLNGAWEKTLVRAKELTKTVGENVIEVTREVTKEGKDKSKEILGKTADILNEKKKDLQTTYEAWSERLQALKNKPEKPLSNEDVEALAGHKASKTITDDNGLVIIAKDETITEEVIRQATGAGKLKELLLAAATSEINDKIESIEKDI